METVNREYVTDVYDELVNALRANTKAARQQVVINSQLKQLKELALADKTITGSNAGNRDAAWNEYFRDYVGAEAHDALTANLDQYVADTKLRLEIARIKVEELRLYIRILEGEQRVQYTIDGGPDINDGERGYHDVEQIALDAKNLYDLGLD